jgi:hypothetical protein
MVSLFPLIHLPRRWQHARGLRLALAFIRPALATRTRAAPRIGIYSPDVGNTLGGCASHWNLFDRCWQHARGLRLALAFIRPRWQHARGLRLILAFIRPALATRSRVAPRIGIYSPGVGNTRGGCTSHWHLFARCLQHARGLRLALAFLYSPDVGNTLRGCAFQPDASNTLGSYAYRLTLAFILFVPGISNMLWGCALCC